MTQQFPVQDQLLLAKIETTPGAEETPAPAANAIKTSNLVWAPSLETDNNEAEHTSSLDAGDPIVLGGGAGMTFGVRLRGSGAAGTAPEWGELLQACGLTEVVQAAAISDTAQAGAVNALTLAAGESSTDDEHKGKPIDLTGGLGSGEKNTIVAYDGTTKVATMARDWTVTPDVTSVYDIPANVLYKPASADLGNITLWAYQHSNEAAVNSMLRKVIGAMGTFTLQLSPSGVPELSFTFQGIHPGAPTQVARPTGVVFDTGQDAAFVNTMSVLGQTAVKFSQLQLDLGASLAQSADPVATLGMDRAAQIRRITSGTLSRYTKNLAGQNIDADFLAGTKRVLATRWGPAAGSRFAITIPAAQYTGAAEEAIDGFAGKNIPFRATGADAGVYLCAF